MQDDDRFMSFRKGLQPLEPTRQISRRKHLRKNDVIPSDIRLADTRLQIGSKSSAGEKFQEIESDSGLGQQS